MKKSILSVFFSAIAALAFGQQDSIVDFKEAKTHILIGANQSFIQAFGDKNIVLSDGGSGFQVGILREHPLSIRTSLTFGLVFSRVQNQLVYQDQTVAYKEYGVRNYLTHYINMPFDFQRTLDRKQNWYAKVGMSLNYAVNDQSFENWERLHHVGDGGEKIEPAFSEIQFKYREIRGFDFVARLGFGRRIHTRLADFTLSLNYGQGIIKKDMNFRQGIMELNLAIRL
ncbi:MAG: hypothetical protein HC817_12770 [Saprospiraceae bacterium]|nr:hypothetical protein [Saprospiraceae bacterium]